MAFDPSALAERLRSAYSGGTVAISPEELSPTDAKAAYAVQECNTQAWVHEGRKVIGRKIGLTAKAVQAQLGVSQPDYGVLFDDMRIENGGVLDAAAVLQPKAEAEIAIILGKDLEGSDITAADVAAAADHAVAAIEIVDSRIADWKINFATTVADNGSSAFFVLGDEKKSLDHLDLYSCGMVLEQNGEVVSIGAGAACLGHPLEAAAWLARTMVENGQPLKAGDILLTGALGPMVPIAAGDHLHVQIGGVGSVEFRVGAA